MITQAGQSSGRNHSLAAQDRPYKVYADGVWYKVVLRHHRIMLPQIIHERERRRLTRKNGQRPLSLLPQGARGQTAGGVCQIEPDLSLRIAYSVLRSVLLISTSFSSSIVLKLYDYLLVNDSKECIILAISPILPKKQVGK